MLIAARNSFLMGGAKLPYDAEVEYIESTGTQYIDTGVVQADDLAIDCTYMEVGTLINYGAVFGCGYKDNCNYNIICRHSQYRHRSNPWFANSNYAEVDVVIPDAEPTTVSLRFGAVRINGVDHVLTSTAGRLYASNIYLFGANNNGPWRRQPCRIYAFSISRGGTRIIDWAPVRVGSGSSAVGYLYDRANPTGGPLGNGLYGNAADGQGGKAGFPANCVGPDK